MFFIPQRIPILVSILLLSFIFLHCKNDKGKNFAVVPNEMQKDISEELGHGYEFLGNGKIPNDELDAVFSKTSLDSFDLPIIDPILAKGLRQQLKLLKYQRGLKKEYAGLKLSKDKLKETVSILLSAQFDNSFGMKHKLEAHQIWGEDKRGNVHFTGYFTPVLDVREKPNALYRYPIYQFPKKWKGRLPSRKQIEGEGVLDSFNLAIAYAKSKLDIYFMQIQGSGYIQYPTGKRQLLAYSGTNKHSYQSIGKYMIKKGLVTPEYVSLKSIKSYFLKNPDQVDSILFINPSYVFFTPVETAPRGAGHVPILPQYSIAVDKKFIPLGSCLLASVPILDDDRNFSHHEFRILLAQDIGGAIKGPGHVDLYTGIGQKAENQASQLHHYGSLWLLLPKDTTTILDNDSAD